MMLASYECTLLTSNLYCTVQKQARRVYEILRLQSTNCANAADYKAYRMDVKRRIFAPYQVNNT